MKVPKVFYPQIFKKTAMANIIEALKRPFMGVQSLLIGTILVAVIIFASLNLPVGYEFGAVIALLIMYIFMLGYGLKCVTDKEESLPGWAPLLPLIKNGVFAVLIIFVGLFIQNVITAWYYPDLALLQSDLMAFAPLSILIAVLFLISLYFLPMSLVEFANEDHFLSAFNKEVIAKSMTLHYLGSWVFVVFLQVLVSAVMYPFMDWALTGVWQLGVFTLLYGLLTMVSTVWSFTLLGQAWDEI